MLTFNERLLKENVSESALRARQKKEKRLNDYLEKTGLSAFREYIRISSTGYHVEVIMPLDESRRILQQIGEAVTLPQ